MNKKRLLKLANFLETVPRKSFTLNLWRSAIPSKPEGKDVGGCGFAGCAIGWAAHAKLFRGLTLEPTIYGGEETTDATPQYGGTEALAAVDRLFGFKEIDHSWNSGPAEYLFLDDNYPNGERTTPKTVAKRIRSFVASSNRPAP